MASIPVSRACHVVMRTEDDGLIKALRAGAVFDSRAKSPPTTSPNCRRSAHRRQGADLRHSRLQRESLRSLVVRSGPLSKWVPGRINIRRLLQLTTMRRNRWMNYKTPFRRQLLAMISITLLRKLKLRVMVLQENKLKAPKIGSESRR